jgi:hypothetical protein
MSVDPLAEIDYDFSTYVFSRNNPTLFKDPTGLSSDMKMEITMIGI